MATFTTEITSDTLSSDNPVHQRLIKAYYLALPYITGDLLEIGCGEGRGISLLQPHSRSYLAVDKIGSLLDGLKTRYPQVEFRQMVLPPLQGIVDNSYDRVVSFQVIEHIKDDGFYLREIHRILKPGGKALITTPNINMTLTRNPWHQREYEAHELKALAQGIFREVLIKGIAGNKKVMEYYRKNKRSVKRITRFDILDLQHRLPARILRIPYDLMNRFNRIRLQKGNSKLVSDITHQDYILVDEAHQGLDLFCIMTK